MYPVALLPFGQTRNQKVRVEIPLHEYKKHYRFEEPNLEWITNHFLLNDQQNVMEERRGGALSSKFKMKTFIRCVADPGLQDGKFIYVYVDAIVYRDKRPIF